MSAHDPGNWVIQFGRKRSTSAEIGDPLRPKQVIHFRRNRRSTSSEIRRRERDRNHHEPRRVAEGADRAVRPHGRGAHRRAGRRARERAPNTRIRRPGRGPRDQPRHGTGLRARLPATARRWIRVPTRPTRRNEDRARNKRPAVRQRRNRIEPGTTQHHGRRDEPEREHAGTPARPILRPGDGHRPRRRRSAAGLELRAQPSDVERRDRLVVEPVGAVQLLRPGRGTRAQRRRPDLDVRRGLLQGPDDHRRVTVAQPGPRKLRRRRQRAGQLGGDGPLPLDRLQGQRADHRLDGGRLRRRRADAEPGRRGTDGDRAVDGDGGRRRPRPDPGRRRGLRPRVQSRHPVGRHADQGGQRTRREPRLDKGRGQPAAHRARGLAEHDDRQPDGPDAERRDRHPPGRRGRRNRTRHGPRGRPGASRRRDRALGRHPGAQTPGPPGRRVHRERHVHLGQLQPEAGDPTGVHGTNLPPGAARR